MSRDDQTVQKSRTVRADFKRKLISNVMIKSQTMETTSDICKQFHAIAESGFPVADSTLQRKAVVSVRKGKLDFSQQQLKQVVILLMGDLPYFLFRPKSITKVYVILLFWSTSLDDSACEVQRRADV